MKPTIAVLFLALAILTPAQTTMNQPAQGSGATPQAQALFALENKWVEALVNSDTATLDSVFADSPGARYRKFRAAAGPSCPSCICTCKGRLPRQAALGS